MFIIHCARTVAVLRHFCSIKEVRLNLGHRSECMRFGVFCNRNKNHDAIFEFLFWKCATGWTVTVLCKEKKSCETDCLTIILIKHDMMKVVGIKSIYCSVNCEGLIFFFFFPTVWHHGETIQVNASRKTSSLTCDIDLLSLVCQWSESLFYFLSNTQKLPLHGTRNVRMLKDESCTVGYYPPRCAGLHRRPRHGRLLMRNIYSFQSILSWYLLNV